MRLALVCVVVGTFAACVVDPIELNDRKCDEDHPCVDGYSCVDQTCERDDGDEDDGSG